MKKYKVLAGVHKERGKVYTKGDVVESDLALDKLFINKFVEVGVRMEEQDTPVPVQKEFENAGQLGQTGRLVTTTQPQPGQNPPAQQPAVVESQQQRHERLVEQGKQPTLAQQALQKTEAESEEASTAEDGDDVTGDFKGAGDGGLCVKKTSDGYDVYDVEALDNPLNEAPFTTKKEAQKFVDKNVKT